MVGRICTTSWHSGQYTNFMARFVAHEPLLHVARVVTGMRDPHPRADGVGVWMLRDAGVEVVEGVCEAAIHRQLGPLWLERHLDDVLRRAVELPALHGDAR